MSKSERFEARLSPEGRRALERIAKRTGLSRAAIIEAVIREADRRGEGAMDWMMSGKSGRKGKVQ